jgi:Na+-driven multidrug efflux pump
MMSYGVKAIIPIFSPVILMSVAVYYIRSLFYGSKEKEGVEIDKKHAVALAILIAIAFVIVLRGAPIEGIKEVVGYV